MGSVWQWLQLIGSACLIVVMLTHVAEAFHVFPAMGWGQPVSAGHYVDLASGFLRGAKIQTERLGAVFSAMRRTA
jgi:hypothetical protein